MSETMRGILLPGQRQVVTDEFPVPGQVVGVMAVGQLQPVHPRLHVLAEAGAAAHGQNPEGLRFLLAIQKVLDVWVGGRPLMEVLRLDEGVVHPTQVQDQEKTDSNQPDHSRHLSLPNPPGKEKESPGQSSGDEETPDDEGLGPGQSLHLPQVDAPIQDRCPEIGEHPFGSQEGPEKEETGGYGEEKNEALVGGANLR